MSDRGRGPSAYVELAEKLVIAERERDEARAKVQKLHAEMVEHCENLNDKAHELNIERAAKEVVVAKLAEVTAQAAVMREALELMLTRPVGLFQRERSAMNSALSPAAGKALLAEVTEYRQLKMRRGQQCDACTRGDHPNCSEWCYCLCGTDPGKALLAEVEALRECADVLRGWAEDGHSPPPDVYERVLAKLDKLKEGE